MDDPAEVDLVVQVGLEVHREGSRDPEREAEATTSFLNRVPDLKAPAVLARGVLPETKVAHRTQITAMLIISITVSNKTVFNKVLAAADDNSEL